MRFLLLAVLTAWGMSATAQPAPCPIGQAVGTLEGADVRARLFTNGNLFFGSPYTNGEGYVVPLTGPDAGASPLFAANLWVAGSVGGEIRASGAWYRNFALRPGLTGADGTPPTPAECASADRIWIVGRDDVRRYLHDGTATDDLRDWPIALGAPVIDGDGIAGNYDLASGDQPALRGDVLAYWAMTDSARPTDVLGATLGVDVTVEATAFLRPPSPTQAVAFRRLSTTTLYRVTVTNRASVPIDSLATGVFLDWDLGNAVDDYVGVDTTLSLGFAYNADEYDEEYEIPPAVGVLLLESSLAPPGERNRFGSLIHLLDTYPAGFPHTAEAFHHELSGRWQDGTAIREGGLGFGPNATGAATRFTLAGDPVTRAFWSEVNATSTGQAIAPNDIQHLASIGASRLAPGESVSFHVALIFAQGSDALDSVTQLRQRARDILALHGAGYFDPQATSPGDVPVDPTSPVGVRRAAPNPFARSTTIRLVGLMGTAVTVRVIDILGRIVEERRLVPTADDEPVTVGGRLAAGAYVVRVSGLAFDIGLPVVKL